jgi:cytochrome c556
MAADIMKIRQYRIFGGVAVALIVIGSGFMIPSAQSHTGAKGVVKDRMELMKTLAGATKAIKKSVARRGKVSTADRKAISENAGIIADHALKSLKMFPKGSDGHPSEATPKVWADRPGFEKSAQALKAAAERLRDTAATGDRKTLFKSFVTMVRGCGSCHKVYRKKK